MVRYTKFHNKEKISKNVCKCVQSDKFDHGHTLPSFQMMKHWLKIKYDSLFTQSHNAIKKYYKQIYDNYKLLLVSL